MDLEVELACSEEINNYFNELKEKAERCYNIASEARKKGFDPHLEPEIIMTEDLASRVEGLVGPKGIAKRIRELSMETQSREMLSLKIAEELVMSKSKINRQEAVDQAVRTGLAILTEGVLVAPIEGIARVEIESNLDGSEFLAIYFAGPIRSAGGTGQAMSVLIGDMVRRGLGLERYKPVTGEIERMKEEMSLYHRRQHLQYEPTAEEIELIISSCPVCVDGEGTEDEEVSGYRNIPRIKTTKIRGGACLVLAEGLCLKAAKLQKTVKHLGIDGWEFLDSITNRILRKEKQDLDQKEGKEEEDEKEDIEKPSEGTQNIEDEIDQDNIKEKSKLPKDIKDNKSETLAKHKVPPNKKYMRDSLAGRPVFSNPSQKGGFRLRYGRARTTGLAALAINPVTMYLLGEFLAIGTQLKIERPGKAGVVTSCDMLEGPIVLLKDQSLIQINTVEHGLKIRDDIDTIVDLGEILIPFGEFAENNHELVPGNFDLNWWQRELENKLQSSTLKGEETEIFLKYLKESPNAKEAFTLAEKLNIPLHPDYNLFWHDISIENLMNLRDFISEKGTYENNTLKIPNDKGVKNILIELCAFHRLDKDCDNIEITQHSLPLIRCLGLDENLQKNEEENAKGNNDIMEMVTSFSKVKIKPKSPTRIGGSMGRPEKAKERMMKPPVHVLFPLGNSGGNQRLVKTAAENIKISIEAGPRRCTICGRDSISTFCACGGHTVDVIRNGKNNKAPVTIFKRDIPLKEMLAQAQKNLSEPQVPDIKGVIGLISKNKTPEPLEKGILRAKHNVFVFKDGTIRFDMTDVPLTHFKPKEIGTSIEQLHKLGYTHDYENNPLTEPDQIVELKPQDIIPSKSCGDYLLNVSKFLDDLLTKFYKIDPYYNADKPSDLFGQIVMGLSPHTSGAVLGRLIGYTNSRVGYAHPFYHAAKRRNCDGDEDCVMLLLDGLINFSRDYLPGTRGGFMDAPLVFMTYINPNEIDKEAQNIDIVSKYPLEFYNATEKYMKPKELETIIETVSQRIGTCDQYENFNFMFDTNNINLGPEETAYTRLGTMIEKMEAQLKLAKQIRAVDVGSVAAKVIESHFLPDMIGNLRSFSRQSFRCPKCHAKYRRIPLQGICTHKKTDNNICSNNLIMTVHKGGVRKYLDVAKDIAERYNVPAYTKQRIILNEKAIDSTFENEKVKKFTLDEFI